MGKRGQDKNRQRKITSGKAGAGEGIRTNQPIT
jgi:hypothetical protein